MAKDATVISLFPVPGNQRAKVHSKKFLATPPHRKSVMFDHLGTAPHFSRGAEIYSEGEQARYLYRVISGTVRACNLLVDGRRQVTEFFFAGDSFGFGAVGEQLASAQAVSDVVVMRYPFAALQRLSETDPYISRRLHEIALRSLARARSHMLLARKTAHERVASFLLEISDRTGCGSHIVLPMTRHDIADYLGLTTETVSRTISAMSRSGMIRLLASSHQIDLIDHQALEAARAGDDTGKSRAMKTDSRRKSLWI